LPLNLITTIANPRPSFIREGAFHPRPALWEGDPARDSNTSVYLLRADNTKTGSVTLHTKHLNTFPTARAHCSCDGACCYIGTPEFNTPPRKKTSACLKNDADLEWIQTSTFNKILMLILPLVAES